MHEQDLSVTSDGTGNVNEKILAEVQTLKLNQRISGRPKELDNVFGILTLQEVIDNIKAEHESVPRLLGSDVRIGLMIDIKPEAYYSSMGINIA